MNLKNGTGWTVPLREAAKTENTPPKMPCYLFLYTFCYSWYFLLTQPNQVKNCYDKKKPGWGYIHELSLFSWVSEEQQRWLTETNNQSPTISSSPYSAQTIKANLIWAVPEIMELWLINELVDTVSSCIVDTHPDPYCYF